MDDSQASSLEQIRALVNTNSGVRFTWQRREEIYAWVEYSGPRISDQAIR
jgi:hypothetical protein